MKIEAFAPKHYPTINKKIKLAPTYHEALGPFGETMALA